MTQANELEAVGEQLGIWTIIGRLPRTDPKSSIVYRCRCTQCGHIMEIIRARMNRLCPECKNVGKEKKLPFKLTAWLLATNKVVISKRRPHNATHFAKVTEYDEPFTWIALDKGPSTPQMSFKPPSVGEFKIPTPDV